MAVVLTSMASALIDIPIVYGQIRSKPVFYRVAATSAAVIVLGLGVMTFGQRESHAIQTLALRTVDILRAAKQ